VKIEVMFSKFKTNLFLVLVLSSLNSCLDLVDTRDGVSGVDRRVFVTKNTFLADFGGFTPDEKCQEAAQAAGLERIYTAILSYSVNSGDARSRLGDSSGYLYLIDNAGSAFIVTKGLLDTDGLWDRSSVNLSTAINMDEYGNSIVGTSSVFTGTKADGTKLGTAAADFCNNWKSSSAHAVRVGDASQVDSKWVDDTVGDCSVEARLYCISQ
jgi:hypothetical protein